MLFAKVVKTNNMKLVNKIKSIFGSTLKKGESIALSTKKLAQNIQEIDTNITEHYKLENIAKQFSDKISSELKLAERKISQSENNNLESKENGMFL